MAQVKSEKNILANSVSEFYQNQILLHVVISTDYSVGQ